MTSNRKELDKKWWFRVIKIAYWLSVATGVVLLGALVIAAFLEVGFLMSLGALLTGISILYVLARFLPWIFFYIVKGGDEVVFLKSRDNEFPLVQRDFVGVLVVFLVLGTIFLIIASFSNQSSNQTTQTEEGTVQVFLGSEKVYSDNLTFGILELANLGSSLKLSESLYFGPRNRRTETGGKFIKANFNLSTSKRTEESRKITNVILIDKENREYGPEGISFCAEENIYPLQDEQDWFSYAWEGSIDLKPSIPCRIGILFEVPDDSGVFSLGVTVSN